MSINLLNVLKDMNATTRRSYQDTYIDYPDGSRGIRMPTFDDHDNEPDTYEEFKANDANKEDV